MKIEAADLAQQRPTGDVNRRRIRDGQQHILERSEGRLCHKKGLKVVRTIGQDPSHHEPPLGNEDALIANTYRIRHVSKAGNSRIVGRFDWNDTHDRVSMQEGA